jgi:hypothetical protein
MLGNDISEEGLDAATTSVRNGDEGCIATASAGAVDMDKGGEMEGWGEGVFVDGGDDGDGDCEGVSDG